MPASRRPQPTGNRLLDRLPEDVYRRLAASLELVSLTIKQPLHRAGALPGYAYFPTAGMVSLMVLMEDGRECEVATVGSEGVVGAQAVLGVDEAPFQATCQIGGAALRMAARPFREAAERLPAFGALLRRYAALCFRNAGQVAACNALHAVEQRLCRRLLAAHDRAMADAFPLPQEFLAEMTRGTAADRIGRRRRPPARRPHPLPARRRAHPRPPRPGGRRLRVLPDHEGSLPAHSWLSLAPRPGTAHPVGEPSRRSNSARTAR